MGLLTDTIADALRSVPDAGSVVRRAHRGMVPAPADESALPDEDPGALTVYRLQKDGGHVSPRAPSAKPVTVERGPSSSSRSPAMVGSEGAVSATNAFEQRDLPSGRRRKESKGSEYRFVTDQSTASNVPFRPIPSLDSVDMSQVPDLSFDSSHVRNSESRTSGQTDGTDEWRREALGAPSEDLLIATGPQPARASTPPRADATDAMDAMDPAAGRAAADVAVAAPDDAAKATVRGETTEAAAPPVLDAPAADARHERARARAEALRTASAYAAAAMRDRGPRLAAGLAAAAAPAPEAEPRVRIGRIDVVVLAPPAPAPAVADTSGPARDFLSRNYLRRS